MLGRRLEQKSRKNGEGRSLTPPTVFPLAEKYNVRSG
jgi:hypothetical protein